MADLILRIILTCKLILRIICKRIRITLYDVMSQALLQVRLDPARCKTDKRVIIILKDARVPCS